MTKARAEQRPAFFHGRSLFCWRWMDSSRGAGTTRFQMWLFIKHMTYDWWFCILLKISFTKWGALRPLQACHFVVRGCFFFVFLCTSKLIRNHFCEISANSRHIHFVDNPLSAVAIWSQVLDSGHGSGSR